MSGRVIAYLEVVEVLCPLCVDREGCGQEVKRSQHCLPQATMAHICLVIFGENVIAFRRQDKRPSGL